MQLDLQVVVSDPELPAAQDFEQWTRAALSIAEHPGGELTLRIVSEEEMSSFNLRFRGYHSSTNVLSFPVDDLPGVTTGILGDILVCPACLPHTGPTWLFMVSCICVVTITRVKVMRVLWRD